MEEIIRLENIVKMYDNGKRTINGVNFSIYEHETVCICGASGSGKTTLRKLIAGIEVPSAGSIIVDGKAVHEMDSDTAAEFRNRTFGMLPRHHGFMNHLTLLENVAMPLAIRKIPARARNRSSMEYMKMLGIAHLIDAYPSQLSSMELQFANLARALSGKPKILLIDKMDADLMKKEQEKMNDLLDTIWELGEVTIIRFTDRENGGLPCDRYCRLEYGQITEVRK
ncbi:ABC transporter ATP-binding protein [Bacteroidia bacterium]|nr:ABC transporter ATP-binding protein [Bacteroidia bacterium]